MSAFQFNTSFENSNGETGNNSFKGKSQGHDGVRGYNCVCTHCERTNHTIETCFLKHGYPPGFKGGGKAQNASSRYQSVASVNAGPNESQPIFGFTQEQYNNILELTRRSKITPKANSISTSPFIMN